MAALSYADARAELVALARDPHTWLGPDEIEWAALLADRARRAAGALSDAPVAPATELGPALSAAARLFDAALFFEVHEVLEPHWLVAEAPARDTLQGLIQIAVGWQHLANGNVAGARSLLAEGAARLSGRKLADIDFDSFARAAAEAASALPVASPPTFPRVTR